MIPRVTVPTTKLQPIRATVLTLPSSLKDKHRPLKHMHSKVMEPMGSPLMSATPRLRSTGTYGQMAYATSYGQPSTGYTTPTAPQAYGQPGQVYGTGTYDTTTAPVTATQGFDASQFAYGTQLAYLAYG